MLQDISLQPAFPLPPSGQLRVREDRGCWLWNTSLTNNSSSSSPCMLLRLIMCIHFQRYSQYSREAGRYYSLPQQQKGGTANINSITTAATREKEEKKEESREKSKTASAHDL